MNSIGDPIPEVPSYIHITVFPVGDEPDPAEQFQFQLAEKHGAEHIEANDYFRVSLEGVVCNAKILSLDDARVFVLVGFPAENSNREDRIEDVAGCGDSLEPIVKLLPKSPISRFKMLVVAAKDERDAHNLVGQYSEYLGLNERSAGTVYGCLLAVFDASKSEEFFGRDGMILTYDHDSREQRVLLANLFDDILHLAVWMGKLRQLYLAHQMYFSQVEMAESDIQEKIQVIMMDIRKPELMKPEHLEHRLRDVTTLYSHLSSLTSAMRRDYTTAKGHMGSIESLFSRWNEMRFEGYPMNTSVELEKCAGFIRPFEIFMERVEALSVQLETVLDAVRTYLNIQEQRQNTVVLERSHEQLAIMSRIAQSQEEARKKEEETKRAVQILQAITISEVVVSITATILSYTVAWLPSSTAFLLIAFLAASSAVFTYFLSKRL